MRDLNVLIIEDEIIIYMHIMKTLKNLGFKNIQIAHNAQEALNITKNSQIDLVFSDIKIDGDKDGIEVSKTIQILYNTPIIFITAYKDEETLIRASDVDFIGYLLKPYRHDELEALIKIAIAKHDLVQQKQLIKYKGYEYNPNKKELLYNNELVELTKKESLFISLIFTHIDSIVNYETIDKTVWFDQFVSDNTRRTFIYRVKNKLPQLNLKLEKNVGIGLLTP